MSLNHPSQQQHSAKASPITIASLVATGAHYGHTAKRWNPKMKTYIYGIRDGIHIIDLAKTMVQIQAAQSLIKKIVQERKSVLFVGTKQQARAAVREAAQAAGEFYVNERWLGGSLTNFRTIRLSVKELESCEKKLLNQNNAFTKKELAYLAKKQEKLNAVLCGIRSMKRVPGLIVLVDATKEHIAVCEAKRLGIPVIALVDTNSDPDDCDVVVPVNDDSHKSISHVLSSFAELITEQKEKQRVASREGDEGSSDDTAQNKVETT